MRLLRNRIAHHEPIHYRHLAADYDRMLTILGWVSADFAALGRGPQPGAGAPRDQTCDMITASARCAGQDGTVTTEYRIERDTMGEVRVPADALWRAQTQRAVENFPISGRGLEPAHIRALAQIKGAAAAVNADLGVLDADLAEAIATAAAHVADGGYDDQFPIDVFQTGSGTSSNMNANEVIATLAARELGRAVHPNDHVNASQSSNDVFPSSIHLAATEAVVQRPDPGPATTWRPRWRPRRTSSRRWSRPAAPT